MYDCLYLYGRNNGATNRPTIKSGKKCAADLDFANAAQIDPTAVQSQRMGTGTEIRGAAHGVGGVCTSGLDMSTSW